MAFSDYGNYDGLGFPELVHEKKVSSAEMVEEAITRNVTGQPVMSVPLHWNDEGLPIGMHVAGKWGDEATLFRLAGQLEKAKPWFHKAPAGY